MSRVALITGVAGGIGRATAQLFSSAGWQVIGVDRTPAADYDGVTHYMQVDVSVETDVCQAAQRLAKQIERLDTLINNAAIQICKPIMQMSVAEWDMTMAVNVRAAFLWTKAVHPWLCAQRGSIVNVSSVHAVATSAQMAAYAASKGALLALTRALAIELAPDGIRVNAVLPGAVNTPMLHAGLTRGHLVGADLADKLAALAQRTVIGRVAEPDEIARAILFLADNQQSSFMTGQALIVDGGATTRLSTE
ncbi:MAG: SDR family oxidoreductase [Acidobacteriota bacterium]|nr:SDR family oxidoreductase [Blastocatellia bacterium]MDW8238667.1 SDR family oxidoreductase [Acidobacteriota bacterium]